MGTPCRYFSDIRCCPVPPEAQPVPVFQLVYPYVLISTGLVAVSYTYNDKGVVSFMPMAHQRVRLLCLSLSTSSPGRSLPHPRTKELVLGWPLVQQLQRCAGCMCCRASFLMTSYRRISATRFFIHRSESAKTSADVRFSLQPLPTVSRINGSCSSGVSDQHNPRGAPRPTDDWVTGAGLKDPTLCGAA